MILDVSIFVLNLFWGTVKKERIMVFLQTMQTISTEFVNVLYISKLSFHFIGYYPW